MDTDTRRDLGGMLIGALALLIGLVLRLGESYAATATGAAFVLGGLIVVVVLGVRLGVRLVRDRAPS